MSIMSYINEKKAKFKEVQTQRRQEANKQTARELKELREERIAQEGRAKLINAKAKEEARISKARETSFNASAIGKFTSFLGSNLKASKGSKSKGGFRSVATGLFNAQNSNRSSGGLDFGMSSNPFGSNEKKEKGLDNSSKGLDISPKRKVF